MRTILLAVACLGLASCSCESAASPEDAGRLGRDVGVDAALACTDSDGDGVDDGYEGLEDVDGDGLPNALDTDSDDDGVSDTLESTETAGARCGRTPVHCGECGIPRFVTTDADGDGVDDGAEAENGTSACLWDTDADGCPDGIDDDECADVVVLPLDGCAPTSVLVTFTVPDGPTQREVRLAIGDLGEDERLRATLTIVPVSSTSESENTGYGFVDVPPGAELTFRIEAESSVPGDHRAHRAISDVTLVDDLGAALAMRPFHLYEPACCVLPI